MFVSQQLRKKNIAEYLLYMWQVEDILRAYDCSLSRIRKEYIEQFDYNEDQKEEMTDWYGDLVRMMNREGCRQKGHLQVNKIVLQQLIELNAELLASTKFPFYTSEYYKVLPYIVELRRRGASPDEPEVETCFNALYGVMMLHLQGKEISQDTGAAISQISHFIGTLAAYFKRDEEKPLFGDDLNDN